jgi:hypothetical protein
MGSQAIESLRLEPGAHASPRDGVCIVELASMMAGEEFSDRPDCVCDVIAAFLRSWNDRLSYSDRQRLRPYAVRVVDTKSDRATTRLRRDICLVWAGADLSRGPLGRSLARISTRGRIALLFGLRPALRLDEGAGEYAARLCFARYDSDVAFDLLDRLLDVGAADDESAPLNGASNSHVPAPSNGHAQVLGRPGSNGNGVKVGHHGSNGNGNGAAVAMNGANGNGATAPRAATNGNGTGTAPAPPAARARG